MPTLFEDLRSGVRVLRARPVLTLTAALTLALGVAANTTVFGWIDSVLLDPIPGAARSSELASLETVSPAGVEQTTAYRDYRDYRDQLRQVSGLAASLANVFTIGASQDARLLWGEFVSSNYFDVLGVRPTRGRSFRPEEASDAPGGSPVAVISDRLWRSAFNADPSAVGRTLRVNQRTLTVVGVAPADFHGTVPGLVFELWIPVSLAPEMNGQGAWLLEDRGERQMWVTGRLRPGVTMEQVRDEAAACARRIAESNPATNLGFSATVLPIWRGHLGAQQLLRSPLQILMAVCLLLFLIVGANVANLQLAVSAARRKEFGIRLALGAGPGRLIRQLLTESLLLSIIGAALGVVLAMWSRQALTWLLPPINLPIEVAARINWRTLAFLVVLCIAGAILTGLAPALHSVRSGIADRLRESSRGSTSGAGARRTRWTLCAAEVSLAMAALVATGVLVRNFDRARSLDPGLDARRVACAKYYVETFCRTRDERRQFSIRLADRLRATPGVAAVSYSNFIPLEFGEGSAGPIEVEGYAPAPGEDMRVANSGVSPGYFDTLGIPLLEGRDFRDQDEPGTARVVIVNQTFARRYLAGRPAVGHRIHSGGAWSTIVGVSRDIKTRRLTEPPAPYVYSAARQTSGGEFWMAFFVRSTGPVSGVLASLDREAAAVHPATRGSAFVPYQDWIGAALYPQRVAATLVAVVGASAVLLAALGMYSVLAFAVTQRTNEFGIRIALGALPWHVFSEVARQGLGLTVVGLVAGGLIAAAALRFASSLAPELSAADPAAFAGAVVLLCAVGLLASYLPARRATKVDPVEALRQE
ncbi:MAG: ABC transporter permease [Acidobacteria bacterium]|nr:ABC transporter permease [Acidobacteriota bacterium]